MSINYLADNTTSDFYCFFSHYFPKDIIHYIDTFRRIIDYKSYFSKTILLKWSTSKPNLYKTSYYQTVYVDQDYLFAKRIDKYKTSYDWFKKRRQLLNN